MDFYAVLDQAVELLRTRGRVSYRALKENFDLDDERLDAIRAELLYTHADARQRGRAGSGVDDERPTFRRRRAATAHGVVLRPGRLDAAVRPARSRRTSRGDAGVLRHVRQGDHPLRRTHRPVPRRRPAGLLRLSPRARGRRTTRGAGRAGDRGGGRRSQRRPQRTARYRAGRPVGVPHRPGGRRRSRGRRTSRADGPRRHPQHRGPPTGRRSAEHPGDRPVDVPTRGRLLRLSIARCSASQGCCRAARGLRGSS